MNACIVFWGFFCTREAVGKRCCLLSIINWEIKGLRFSKNYWNQVFSCFLTWLNLCFTHLWYICSLNVWSFSLFVCVLSCIWRHVNRYGSAFMTTETWPSQTSENLRRSKSFFRTNTKRSDGEEEHRLKCLLLCLIFEESWTVSHCYWKPNPYTKWAVHYPFYYMTT